MQNEKDNQGKENQRVNNPAYGAQDRKKQGYQQN